MQQKLAEYKRALKRLFKAEKYAVPLSDLEAEIVYLRAVCYEGLDKCEEARGAFRYVIDKFPDTRYAYKAKEKLRSTCKAKHNSIYKK